MKLNDFKFYKYRNKEKWDATKNETKIVMATPLGVQRQSDHPSLLLPHPKLKSFKKCTDDIKYDLMTSMSWNIQTLMRFEDEEEKKKFMHIFQKE